jgi:NAD(P)-dependent dehydrogenase (short-subunit alcohol dehydrogenase family)
VTGAGSGIGRASAVLFAKEGAFVALVDRDRAGLQETLTAIEGDNGEASVHVGDVSEADFAQTVVARSQAARPPRCVDGCGLFCGTVITTDPADWDAVFRTNVGGTRFWSRAAVPRCSGRAAARSSRWHRKAIAGGKATRLYRRKKIISRSGRCAGFRN